MSETNDLTAIYYTANKIPDEFAIEVRRNLITVTEGIPIVSIEQKKDTPVSHLQIYKNALSGAYEAKTKYIAFCEDDILYTPDHFSYRPQKGKFAYNMSAWSIYTWVCPPMFSYKDRRNMYSLICERDLFIEAMEERFKKYPVEKEKELGEEYFVKYFAEPGKYERQLGVTIRETEKFYSKDPLVAFSHETALSFKGLGKRKKLGFLKAYDIPYWHTAKEIRSLYK